MLRRALRTKRGRRLAILCTALISALAFASTATGRTYWIDGRYLCSSTSAMDGDVYVVSTTCIDTADPLDDGGGDPGGDGPGGVGGGGEPDFPTSPTDDDVEPLELIPLVDADCSMATSDAVAGCYKRANIFCDFYGAAIAAVYCKTAPVETAGCALTAKYACKALYEAACEGDRQLIEVPACEEAQEERDRKYLKQYKIELKTEH